MLYTVIIMMVNCIRLIGTFILFIGLYILMHKMCEQACATAHLLLPHIKQNRHS